jgi:hypothetical protein
LTGVTYYCKQTDTEFRNGRPAGTWLSDYYMRLTEFGKAISKEKRANFLKEYIFAEADFASHCRGGEKQVREKQVREKRADVRQGTGPASR